MKFFGHNPIDPNWRHKADQILSSVTQFLIDLRKGRGRRRMTKEEYILDRKLIFLLDDLRRAIHSNDPTHLADLTRAIDQCWIELYEARE